MASTPMAVPLFSDLGGQAGILILNRLPREGSRSVWHKTEKGQKKRSIWYIS